MARSDFARQMQARGYNVYRSVDENGRGFGSIEFAIEQGLALPSEQIFEREGKGVRGAVPIDSRHSSDAYFMLAPQVENPNSPEQVLQRIRELEQRNVVPKKLLGRFSFTVDGREVIVPDSFPIIN